jgi:signal transduction histidine kinase/ligand-binding sensor domain-containing protein/DNA-binding response OmpR family regulator
MLRNFLYSVFILTSLFAEAQSYDLQFRNVSPQGGLTYSSVKAIAEDARGLMWFGTEHGLFRYNTTTIQKYIHQQEDPHSIPSNNVLHLFKDRSGRLWISTYGALCFFDESGQSFTTIRLKEDPQVRSNSTIRQVLQNQNGDLFTLHSDQFSRLNLSDSVYEALPLRLTDESDVLTHAFFDATDNLWIGTDNGYVYFSQPPYKDFSVFCRVQESSVRCLKKDNNTLWIGYEWGGVDHVNEQGLLIEHYDQRNTGATYLPHNRVRQIVKDQENRIWIATYSGLLIISKSETQLIRKNPYNKLTHNSIHSMFIDSRNSIWIGTWSGGVAYYSAYDHQFLHFNMSRGGNSLSMNSNVVSSFAEEPDGTVWIGTENGILNRFDRKDNTFKPFVIQRASTGTGNIKCIALDHHNRLWVGTLSNGLWYFDKQSQLFRHVDIFNVPIVNLYAILPDENGLWLGTYNIGLFYYDFSTQKVIAFRPNATDPNSVSSIQIRAIFKDSYGGLWVGTHSGLNYKPKGSSNFTRYYYNNTKGQRISNNEVFTVWEDHSGKIWIGTAGGGVDCYDPETRQFTNLTPKEGLAGYNVYGVLDDNRGNLWFSTDNGISCYHPDEKIFKNYSQEDGLQGNQFNPGAVFKCRDGSMLFGGPNGFNLCMPNAIKTNPFVPEVVLTNLFINNKKVTSTDPNGPLKRSLSSLEKLELKYFQNSLIFEFVSTNYIQPQKNQFRYRLINYEDNWQEAQNEDRAIFTKIPPGTYTLEVVSANNDGVWSTTPTQLAVTIFPPLWLTGYAYAFYFLLIATILWFIRKEMTIRKELKEQLLLERVTRENEEKLHQMKLQFFTNISHDFRTPLSLILSPLEDILSDPGLSPKATGDLTMIQRNAKRLRRLIDQLLDFRKLEFNKAVYTPAYADINGLCRDICHDFEMYACDKSISFRFESSLPKAKIVFDPDKMDKVIFNLLSNAFKYTPEHGEISLSAEVTGMEKEMSHFDYATDPLPTGTVLLIRVKDNGSGIGKDELANIFERFYQTQGSYGQGAGIGLHLCREYVRMHQGTILVQSSPGNGAVFTLLIPLITGGSVITESATNKESWAVEQPEPDDDVFSDEKQTHSILLVEDNPEMQKYIRRLLKDEYRVLIAGNGIQGFEMANELYPDLIISDIMMPGIDGFELCRRLKEDIRTSHIPVILLTALSETDKKVSGLKTGADAYLTKPFDNKLLKAQIANLLAARRRMQQAFTESQEKWAADANVMPPDRKLMDKAIAIVDKHILDANFTVEQLAAELNMSRSSLHRKMRALTSQSATEFIRYIRLKKAIKLMKEGNYNIDEVGYAVGFNSHSYFTQSFKKQFGKTPSAYLNDQKNVNKKPSG